MAESHKLSTNLKPAVVGSRSAQSLTTWSVNYGLYKPQFPLLGQKGKLWFAANHEQELETSLAREGRANPQERHLLHLHCPNGSVLQSRAY